MKLLRLVPEKTAIAFVRHRTIAYVLSAILMVGSVGLFFAQGLNFGIDFKGGTLIEIGTEEPADLGRIRTILGGLGFGDVQVQAFGAVDDVLIRVETQAVEGDARAQEIAQNEVVNTVKQALEEGYGGAIEYRRVEVVGPKVSGELVKAGSLAVVVAVAMMLIYIWFRFEWQFSLGAVLALVHDVVLTLGIFSLLQLEFTLAIIAALLTIIGYSMNDTVVVYDRVRENLRKFKKMDLAELLDLSINGTLSRTTMTSITTLIALLSLYILGGEVIRGFTFAMIWGVIVGTYSSIFVAAPLLLVLGVKRDWSGLETKPANIRFAD
ncbi:MAG: protein translocase subunit SecF [Alphaproteobacteria bacterium]